MFLSNLALDSIAILLADVHLWDDGYDMGGDRGLWRFSDRGIKYPLTPGHEISGAFITHEIMMDEFRLIQL